MPGVCELAREEEEMIQNRQRLRALGDPLAGEEEWEAVELTAVAKERERCALVIDNHVLDTLNTPIDQLHTFLNATDAARVIYAIREQLAAAIRSRGRQ